MTGTLHVTANGTPKPHTPGNPAPNPADTNPPHATLAIVDARVAAVLHGGGVRVRVTTNEPARFKLTATAGKTIVSQRTLVVNGGRLNTKLPLTRKGRQLLLHARSVRLKLAAKVNDAADNRSSASATRTLR
jgi:hypothetical protein